MSHTNETVAGNGEAGTLRAAGAPPAAAAAAAAGALAPPVGGYKHKYNLKVGDKDENGEEISEIYECEPGSYFIYARPDHDLQVKAEDPALPGKNLDFSNFSMKIADYLSNEPSLRGKYITHVAYAWKNLYDGNAATAVDTLKATQENMAKCLRRKTILPYLSGSLTMVFVCLITYFITYKVGNLNDFGFMLFNAVTMASLGGFLSIAVSLQNINVDVQDKFWSNVTYGFLRIMIAMISGVMMYFLIQAKVAIAFIPDLSSTGSYLLYVAFFVSGFSERLIANMMLDFEKKGT